MLTCGRLLFAALLLGATTTSALAADEEGSMLPGTFTGNVALANDYSFRGLSQTQRDATIQGGLDWDSGYGFYLGTWGSNFQFGAPGEGSLEWDIYGGYRGTIGKFSYDISAIGYVYPGTAKALNYNWWELTAKAGYDFGFASLTGSVAYTPDYTGGLGKSWYYSGKIAIPLGSMVEGLSIDGTIGYTDMRRAGPVLDYTDYSIGITYAMKWFTTDVRFVDTDIAGCVNFCEDRVVVKISRSF